tara:strand:- start:45 stop:3371 length:3327 start_codon:yes stop_codon:yes gene_type:complete
MGVIKYETPNGVLDFEIEGDSPTEEESSMIEESLFQSSPQAPSLETGSYEELQKYYGGQGSDGESEIKVSNEGEVKDLGLQYYVGRGDTDEERQLRLSNVFGEEGVIKLGTDDFALNLDNIAPEIKQKYGLDGKTGTIRFNQKGFTGQDVSAFFGSETVPLVAALGAGLSATGLGTIAGIGLVGAAGAIGKAVDEFIIEDIFEGLQKQTNKEILTDVAIQGLIEAGGEGLGRGIGAGIRRLIKGKGPAADPERVKEFMDQGLSRKAATKASREEESVRYNKIIEEGGSIPALTLTGKPILGRSQAIWESIFPNDKAVAQNVTYVEDILKKVASGDLADDVGKQAIYENAEKLALKLSQQMADPDKAAKIANKHLKDILKKEFDAINKVLEDSTAVSEGLSTELQQGLHLATKLFQSESGVLYRNADDLLKGQTIDLKPLQAQIDSFGVLQGGDKMTGGVFQLIRSTDNLNISDIPALRAAIRATQSDPSLMGTPASHNIGSMLDTLDVAISKKEQELAATFLKGNRSIDDIIDSGDEAIRMSPSGQALPPPSAAEINDVRQGLDLLAKANKHYKDGADIINNGLLDSITIAIKGKHAADISAVVQQVVLPNQPNKLKAVLDAVTPDVKQVDDLIEAGRANPNFFPTLKQQILNGDIKAVNEALSSLQTANKKQLLTVPEVYAKLPLNDPTRIRLQKDFAETLQLYDDLSKAGSKPKAFREGFRSLLAKNWMDNALMVNRGDDGLNLSALSNSFDNIGKEVQQELFGADVNAIRKTMRDFKLLDKKSAEAINDVTFDITNQNAKLWVDRVKSEVAKAEIENQDSFLRALKGGPLEPDRLVAHVLKNPKNYDKLEKVIGPEAEETIKNLVMSRIVSSGFPQGKITNDLVEKGAWGDAWLKTINDLNKSGSLTKILGKTEIDNLKSVAKAGETVSNSVLKGKTGLAAAGYAAGFTGAFLLNPLAAVGGAVAIITASKLMRSKPVMKYLSSPRLRAYEAERAINAGADLGTKRNLAAEKMRENAVRAIRTILVNAGAYSTDKGSDAVSREIVEPAVSQVQQATQQQAPTLTQPAPPVQGPPPTTPQQQSMQTLRNTIDPRVQAQRALVGGNP